MNTKSMTREGVLDLGENVSEFYAFDEGDCGTIVHHAYQTIEVVLVEGLCSFERNSHRQRNHRQTKDNTHVK